MRMRAHLVGLTAILAFLSPGPARANAGNFIVFFASGSAELSPAMRAVLDNFAAYLEGRNAILLGNADRAGDSGYNRALACRRARAVRAYLVSRGIAASRLGVRSGGEDRPMEATADGVAEPQNRYVQLTVVEQPLSAAEGVLAQGCAPPS